MADSEVTTQMKANELSKVLIAVSRPGAVFKYPKSNIMVILKGGVQ